MINRVLVVNDSPLERKIIRNELSRTYYIAEAESGKQTLEILEREKFDIAILDNIMVDETGYDVARKIRMNPKYDNLPLLLTSSSDNPIDEMAAFESGFSAYLVKSKKGILLDLIRTFEKRQLDKPVNVLIVDDSRVVRTMLAQIFLKEGFTVKTAESGSMALEILKEFHPDFITMDLEMPGIDGFETTRQIRSNRATCDIPVIVISSVDTVEYHARSLEAGAAEYFVKPFQPIKIIDYIKNVILSMNQQKKGHVLIIGNSNTSTHVITYTLWKNGFNTIAAVSKEEAFKAMSKEGFEMIIIDYDNEVNFPGIQILKEIKEDMQKHYLKIPVIVTTSTSDKYAILEAFRSGADDYLIKPFTKQELMIRVQTHLANKETDEIVL